MHGYRNEDKGSTCLCFSCNCLRLFNSSIIYQHPKESTIEIQQQPYNQKRQLQLKQRQLEPLSSFLNPCISNRQNCYLIFTAIPKSLQASQNKPAHWHGPIVMNTEEQIMEALSDLRNNKFVREKNPIMG